MKKQNRISRVKAAERAIRKEITDFTTSTGDTGLDIGILCVAIQRLAGMKVLCLLLKSAGVQIPGKIYEALEAEYKRTQERREELSAGTESQSVVTTEQPKLEDSQQLKDALIKLNNGAYMIRQFVDLLLKAETGELELMEEGEVSREWLLQMVWSLAEQQMDVLNFGLPEPLDAFDLDYSRVRLVAKAELKPQHSQEGEPS
jgi:hypothetical protein